MAELRALRAERKAARDQALEETLLLAQLSKSKGETYNPATDFQSSDFVFSPTEIEALLTRKKRLAEARALPKIRQNPIPAHQMPSPHEKETETDPKLGNLANSLKNSA